MRIAFLVGADTPSTLRSIEAVCRLPNIHPAGILLDTGVASRRLRIANLRRNMKREGIGYLYRRIVGAIRDWLDARAALVPKREIDNLLRRAFPEADLNLEDLAARFQLPVIRAGNLNHAAAVESLSDLSADLGVVIGTRILKPVIFSVPRLGCINLHKGAVPDYRGTPPGFWEIYDGAKTAGVTVHWVDAGLDTGDVVGTAEVPIHPLETPETLRAKLDLEGARLLSETVCSIADGTCKRRPQPASATRPPAVNPPTLSASNSRGGPRTSGPSKAMKSASSKQRFTSSSTERQSFIARAAPETEGRSSSTIASTISPATI